MTRTVTLAVGVVAWCGLRVAARADERSRRSRSAASTSTATSPPRALRRAARYSHGEQVLWLDGHSRDARSRCSCSPIRLPRTVREMGLGRISSAIVVGMVLLVTLWFVGLPFSLADLWWQHHWGLGPFDVLGLAELRSGRCSRPRSSPRCSRSCCSSGSPGASARWWLDRRADLRRASRRCTRSAARTCSARPTHPLRDRGAARGRRAHRARRARQRHARYGVQDVSTWTSQANAFTVGFGPSTHVVVWDTLLDGRFCRGEEDVVLAHELGHVRSRHILKALGWTALIVGPTLWLVGLAIAPARRARRPGEPAARDPRPHGARARRRRRCRTPSRGATRPRPTGAR